MRSVEVVLILWIVTFTLQDSVAQRRQPKPTTGLNQTTGITGRSGGGILLGGSRNNATSGINALRNLSRGQGLSVGGATLATTTISPPFSPVLVESGSQNVSVGLLVPFSLFYRREYERAVANVFGAIQKGKMKIDYLFSKYKFTIHEVSTFMITVSPSPKDIVFDDNDERTVVRNYGDQKLFPGDPSCVTLDLCPTLHSRLIRPSVFNLQLLRNASCGFTTGGHPLVWCHQGGAEKDEASSTLSPTTTFAPPGAMARENLPSGLNGDECGSPFLERISGGQRVGRGEFPWAVAVAVHTPSGSQLVCGGALVSDDFVLTAAHCVSDPSHRPRNVSHVRIGAYNISKEKENGAENIDVERIFIHDGFRERPFVRDDIALLKLKTKVTFGSTVGPICVPLKDETNFYTPDSIATVVGWGSDGHKTKYDILQKVDIPIIPGDLCKRRFRRIRVNILPQIQICAGQRGKDSCNILDSLCGKFLSANVSAILYLTNSELYGRSTAASQYFLQLASYLGIPVIAWNADNSGLLRRAGQRDMILQLAPSIAHQARAMLSILVRYTWHKFAIVTSKIAGHEDFVQAIQDHASSSEFKFTTVAIVVVINEEDLLPLVGSEARILLLYSTRDEAGEIMKGAGKLGLTGANYVWIVTQSAIGNSHDAPVDFPVGMLGVHFNTSYEALTPLISTTLKVFLHGVDSFVADSVNDHISLSPSLSCAGQGDGAKWANGDRFYKTLKNVSIDVDTSPNKPPIHFNSDGTLKSAELQIMNLRPGPAERALVWEQIGVWQSWKEPAAQLDIKDIIWPGYSHKPPDGVADKYNLKISFLEEPPYIKMADPDPVTGQCSPERGISCRIAPESAIVGLNHSEVMRNSSYYQCCSGLCIDLLSRFSTNIGFNFELARVADAKWGSVQNGKWNGLIAELINRKVDVALASLMINSEREAVVDFSVPFMDSGVSVLTAKRTGIISPTAFLEPFDPALWLLVCLVGIQVYSLAIFSFEWLSPIGFNMKGEARAGAQFSLFRSFWLVWARLFQASVHVDPPRGFTAKVVVHVWSMFAVVFLATYTANLAVFMITREESHEFEGIHDKRLTNPTSLKPPLRFGTVQFTHTDSLLQKRHPDMHVYMKQYYAPNVSHGVAQVRDGTLDAFLYDGPVLEYNVLQDTLGNCSLLLEGSWYAHTGYGLAFPRHSKYLPLFNKFLMEYKDNGDLERLQRFYFTGPCSRQRDSGSGGGHGGRSSNPLALEQFYSAFFLLFCGVVFACILLGVEFFYASYIQRNKGHEEPGCLTLISQNMGRAFNYPYGTGPLYEGSRLGFRIGRRIELQATACKDPACTSNLLRTQHHLKLCMLRCRQLENRLRLISDPGYRKKRSASCFSGGGRTANMTFSELSVSAILSPHEFTRNHHIHRPYPDTQESGSSSRSSSRFREHLYRPSLTEIAEIETVL